MAKGMNSKGSKPALNSKGLRRFGIAPHGRTASLQASPEFKGIKTNRYRYMHKMVTLQASPEFKGIKT